MSSVDQQGLKLLREAWEALGRQAETTAACGAGDRRTRRLNEAFVRSIVDAMQRLSWVCLRLDGPTVHVRGKVLVEGEVWGHLYELGVRGVSIETTDPRELSALGDLLARDWSRRHHFDQDLSRALWRGGLRGCWVDLRAAPREDDLAVAQPDLEGLRSLQAALEGDGLPALGDNMLSEAGEEILARLRRDLAHEAPEMDELHDLVDVMELHAASLRNEVMTVAAGADISVDSVGRVAFELALLCDSRAMEQLGQELARHLRTCMRAGDADGASDLVRRLGLLFEDDMLRERPSLKKLRAGLGVALDDPEAFAAELEALDPSAGPAMLSVLLTVPPESARKLCAVSAACSKPAWRQVLADALVVLCGDDAPERLATLLEQSGGRDALLPLLALARVDSPSTIGLCLKFLQKEQSEFREAALVALRPHGGERVRRGVLHALEDRSERVRVEALRWISVYRTSEAVPILAEQCRGGPFFTKGSAIESRAWLMAYARAGRADAAPLLLKLLREPSSGQQRPPEFLLSVTRATLSLGGDAAQAVEQMAREDDSIARAVNTLRAQR
jgi:hypothetical protein